MTEIKIGGMDIPLYYSSLEMIAIQEEIGCTAFQLNDEVFGVVRNDEDSEEPGIHFGVVTDPQKTKKLGTLIRILGNAGLEQIGKEPDLTDKWILRNIKPVMILPYAVAVLSEINAGNTIEKDPSESEKPVDEVLEEQNAKKQPGN